MPMRAPNGTYVCGLDGLGDTVPFLAAAARTIKTTPKLPPQTRPVVRDATREELLEKYNDIARGVKSLMPLSS